MEAFTRCDAKTEETQSQSSPNSQFSGPVQHQLTRRYWFKAQTERH